MAIKIVPGTEADVLSVEDAKQYLNIDADISNFDDLVKDMINAATERAESYTHRPLLTKTYLIGFDRFTREMALSPGNCQSVAWVKYYDVTGTQQTLDASYYIVDDFEIPGRVVLAPCKQYPEVQRRPNAVQIQCTSGYGDDPDSVPAGIIQAIKMMISTWFDNRSTALIGDKSERFANYPDVVAANFLMFPHKLVKAGA